MHDKVYNHFSTESNIGSRKICVGELVFLKFFCAPYHDYHAPSPSCFRDGYSRCWSQSYLFNSKTKTSQVWLALSLFWACFIFRKVELGEYRIFCSHFGILPLCQTVVKSCSCQFLVRWFMVKGFICAKVVWKNTMMLFWFDCLFLN